MQSPFEFIDRLHFHSFLQAMATSDIIHQRFIQLFLTTLHSLLFLVNRSEALPSTFNSTHSNTIDHAQVFRCPEQNLTELLGASRHHLQHYTPNLLCQSPSPYEQFKSCSSVYNQDKNRNDQEVMSFQRQNAYRHIPGCSADDLRNLMIQDYLSGPCPAEVMCSCDSYRYPAVLYRVRRTSQANSCPDQELCQPIVRRISVLRRNLNKMSGCPEWTKRRERIITGYRCKPREENNMTQ